MQRSLPCLSLSTEYWVLDGRIQRLQRLRSIGQQNTQPSQFAIPVGGHEPALQLGVGQHVGRFSRRGVGSQQHEFMRPILQPVRVPDIDAIGVGLHNRAVRVAQVRPLLLGRVEKADST